MELRDKLLDVACRIFAEAGYRGTTTRRVAQEAGVNEVTLFRHFGSKDELIRDALAACSLQIFAPLPAVPVDPEVELVDWALIFHGGLCQHSQLVRRLLGETTERPDLVANPCEGADDEMRHLVRYLEQLRDQGRLEPDANVECAGPMLVGTLFTDAVWRDFKPLAPPIDATVRALVKLVLKSVGYTPRAGWSL